MLRMWEHVQSRVYRMNEHCLSGHHLKYLQIRLLADYISDVGCASHCAFDNVALLPKIFVRMAIDGEPLKQPKQPFTFVATVFIISRQTTFEYFWLFYYKWWSRCHNRSLQQASLNWTETSTCPLRCDSMNDNRKKKSSRNRIEMKCETETISSKLSQTSETVIKLTVNE